MPTKHEYHSAQLGLLEGLDTTTRSCPTLNQEDRGVLGIRLHTAMDKTVTVPMETPTDHQSTAPGDDEVGTPCLIQARIPETSQSLGTPTKHICPSTFSGSATTTTTVSCRGQKCLSNSPPSFRTPIGVVTSACSRDTTVITKIQC